MKAVEERRLASMERLKGGIADVGEKLKAGIRRFSLLPQKMSMATLSAAALASSRGDSELPGLDGQLDALEKKIALSRRASIEAAGQASGSGE